MKNGKLEKIAIVLFFTIIITIGIYLDIGREDSAKDIINNTKNTYEISDVSNYSGKIYVEINNNVPVFSDEDMNIVEDYYSNLKNGKVRNGYDKNMLGKGK